MNTSIRVNTDEEDCEGHYSSSQTLATLTARSEQRRCHRVSFPPPPRRIRLSPTEVIMRVITIIKDEDAPRALRVHASEKRTLKLHAADPIQTGECMCGAGGGCQPPLSRI